RELEEDERDRLPLSAPLEQRQQLAVVADRLVERVLLARLVPGPGQVLHGLVLVGRREPVVGEQAERLLVTLAVPRLEPLRRATVEALTRVDEERPVRRLLDQGVLEPELGRGPPPALAQEVEPLELVERVCELAVRRSHAFEQRQPEVAAED